MHPADPIVEPFRLARFIPDPDADTTGIGGMDEIEVAPARVVEVFGYPPSRGDEYKISGEYIFRDETISAVDEDVVAFKEWLLGCLNGEMGLPANAADRPRDGMMYSRAGRVAGR